MFDRRIFNALSRDPDTTVRTPPVFPLPALNGQPPVVLVFDPDDPGVELAYETTPSDNGALVRPTTRETTLYNIPRLMPVFVVSEGTVVYAREHVDGYAILIDHRNGWATYYSRLQHMFVMPTERRLETRVAGGDIMGYVGASRAGPLHPLRFELWRCTEDDEYETVDPIRYMHRWRLQRWNDARTQSVTAPTPSSTA